MCGALGLTVPPPGTTTTKRKKKLNETSRNKKHRVNENSKNLMNILKHEWTLTTLLSEISQTQKDKYCM
jgi:hypothetical protein